MNIIFLIITLLASILLYSSHPHQGWFSQPLASKPWRYLGALLLAIGLVCACSIFSTITAVFAWIAISLLSFSLLPFLSLLIHNKRTSRVAHKESSV